MTNRIQARLTQWFGADTLVCESYAGLLSDCAKVIVPMCGGLSIVALLTKTANSIQCSDKHHHAINLYRVLSRQNLREQFLEALEFAPFHADLLGESQFACASAGDGFERLVKNGDCSIGLAVSYFVTSWMGRGAEGGTAREFNSGLPFRMHAGGGASHVRFRSSIESVRAIWGAICERCEFRCCDWREIVSDCLKTKKPDARRGHYVDPPWWKDGDKYRHKFTWPDHIDLRDAMLKLADTDKVVIRYGDHERIRDLYSSTRWHIREVTSRSQSNGEIAELCITNF